MLHGFNASMSSLDEVIAIAARQAAPPDDLAAQICEHKGVGHPDSICDGVAEARILWPMWASSITC